MEIRPRLFRDAISAGAMTSVQIHENAVARRKADANWAIEHHGQNSGLTKSHQRALKVAEEALGKAKAAPKAKVVTGG